MTVVSQVFGIIVIVFVATMIPLVVLGFILAPITDSSMVTNLNVLLLGNLVITAFFNAPWAVIGAVGYHDLRVAKEGIDVEQIAAVFD